MGRRRLLRNEVFCEGIKRTIDGRFRASECSAVRLEGSPESRVNIVWIELFLHVMRHLAERFILRVGEDRSLDLGLSEESDLGKRGAIASAAAFSVERPR